MTRWMKEKVFPTLSGVEILAFFAFCISVPFLLPVLELWHGVLWPAPALAGPPFTVQQPFFGAMSLAAMFTSLAFLFVCLLKTAYAHMSHRLVAVAAVSYVLGYVVVDLRWAGIFADSPTDLISGVLLGFGGAILTMAWISKLQLIEFKTSLRVVWLAFCALALCALVLPIAGPSVTVGVLTLAAFVAATGCVRLFFRRSRQDDTVLPTGANWWDVFSRFDISLVEGSSDFKTPFARAAFFVVAPLAMILLFVAGRNFPLPFAVSFTPVALACVVAALTLVPLVRFSTDQVLINFSFRLFLPLVAFAVLAVNAWVDPSLQLAVIVVGALVFCAVYVVVTTAMFLVMAGRMRSLALPAAAIMVIGACLVCLLSYANADGGALGMYRKQVLLALFISAAVLFMVAPSARLWKVVLAGIDAAESGSLEARDVYAKRCRELADTFSLTPREAEILSFLGRGHTSAFVAEELVVAESTVRSHRKNIYRKLGISSREELFGLLDNTAEQDE